MKYILVAAGLLFSLTSFAADQENTDNSGLVTEQNREKPRVSIIGDISQHFKSGCQSFCSQYGADVQTCDINVTGPHQSYNAPEPDGSPAAATGNSLALSYNIICGEAPH